MKISLAYQKGTITNAISEIGILNINSWQIPQAHASSVVWSSLPQYQKMIGVESTTEHEHAWPEGERCLHSRPMSPGPL